MARKGWKWGWRILAVSLAAFAAAGFAAGWTWDGLIH